MATVQVNEQSPYKSMFKEFFRKVILQQNEDYSHD